MNRRRLIVGAVCVLAAAACGHTVIVAPLAQRPAAAQKVLKQELRRERQEGTRTTLSQGGASSVNISGDATRDTAAGVAAPAGSKCATTSNPAEGYTDDSLTIGTIIPLTGALRPLGEQVLSVMRLAVQFSLNQSTHIPGPYSSIDWGCPTRDGVFGRHVSLKVYSLQNNTPEEALAGMRRLIDV